MKKEIKHYTVSELDEEIRKGVHKFNNILVTGEMRDINWCNVSFNKTFFFDIKISGYNNFYNLCFFRSHFNCISFTKESFFDFSLVKFLFVEVDSLRFEEGSNFEASFISSFKLKLSNIEGKYGLLSVKDSFLAYLSTSSNLAVGRVNFDNTKLRKSDISRSELKQIDEAGGLAYIVKFNGDRVKIL